MADDSMWGKVKSAFEYEEPKIKTPVKDLDPNKVAGFMKGFSGDADAPTDAMKRRLQKLSGT